MMEVETIAQQLLQLHREEAHGALRRRIIFHYSGHLVKLFRHHGRDEVDDNCKKEQRFKKRYEHGGSAPFELEQLTVVLNERFEYIGYEASYQEGEQHIFQDVDEPNDSKHYGYGNHHADHTVQCEGLTVGHKLKLVDSLQN